MANWDFKMQFIILILQLRLKTFPEKLAKMIEDGGYYADQVFNADEKDCFGIKWLVVLTL